MALTTGGIEQTRQKINQFRQNLSQLANEKNIETELRSNPDFLKFVRTTNFGQQTMSSLVTFSEIVKYIADLMEKLCHNTLEYAKVQEQYNNNDFSATPNYVGYDYLAEPKTPSYMTAGMFSVWSTRNENVVSNYLEGNFNTSNFEVSLQYTESETQKTIDNLQSCKTITGELAQIVSSNPQLSNAWEQINQSFASLIEKYSQRSKDLNNLVKEFSALSIDNDSKLSSALEQINSSLTRAMEYLDGGSESNVINVKELNN